MEKINSGSAFRKCENVLFIIIVMMMMMIIIMMTGSRFLLSTINYVLTTPSSSETTLYVTDGLFPGWPTTVHFQ